MVDARELTRIALERSMTAKEAVVLMGEIAEKYGFYAADWSGGDDSKGEGGEALTVVDPNEAWVFHVLSDDTGTSAVWAAQRVQDDHVSWPGNFFMLKSTKNVSLLQRSAVCCPLPLAHGAMTKMYNTAFPSSLFEPVNSGARLRSGVACRLSGENDTQAGRGN